MAEILQETVDRLTTFISENYSEADVSPGSVLSELLVKLAAAVQNQQYNYIDSLSQGKAITQVLQSETDSYLDTIDLIASNYNTSRSEGKRVTGNIKVTVSTPNTYSFVDNLTFIQPALGLRYVVTAAFDIEEEPDLENGELKLYEKNGVHYFILPVVAENVGAEYQVSSGTIFSVVEPFFINNFVKAEAYGNFTSGAPIDTDKQLVAKFKQTLGSSRFESPAGIANRIKQTYPSFQTLSVVGANDPEMLRSKQNVLGISTFGKADVYVRTSTGPELKTAVVTGRKIQNGKWVIELDNSFCSGFYRLSSILPVVDDMSISGTLLTTNISYGYRQFMGTRNNEINNALEARFSKYQTARVEFTYNETPNMPVALGQPIPTKEFEITAIYQPYIEEIQNLLIADDERFACADYLVKAVLPCFVSLEIPIVKKQSTDTYDSLGLNKLKQDMFTYINTISFGEDLYASRIIDLCHNYDIARVDLPVVLKGDIFCNDGSIITITDTDYLSIPTNISKGVSKMTTLYFTDYYRFDQSDELETVDNIGIKLI
jgi:hypothetical protein